MLGWIGHTHFKTFKLNDVEPAKFGIHSPRHTTAVLLAMHPTLQLVVWPRRCVEGRSKFGECLDPVHGSNTSSASNGIQERTVR